MWFSSVICRYQPGSDVCEFSSIDIIYVRIVLCFLGVALILCIFSGIMIKLVFLGVALLAYELICYITLCHCDSISRLCMGVVQQQLRSGITRD